MKEENIMKIYALNELQSHSDNVRVNVKLHGNIVLRGFLINNEIQLLEGSHRMAFAVELGVPITIILFGEDEIVPHDCDDIISCVTGLRDRATVYELSKALLKERGLYNQAVYEKDDHKNISIIDASDGTGKMAHFRATHKRINDNETSKFSELYDVVNSPSNAFPEKVWELMFGEKNAYDKNILVVGNNESRPAIAFSCLGANVTYLEMSEYRKEQTLEFLKKNDLDMMIKDFQLEILDKDKYDIVYTTSGVCENIDDLYNMFICLKRALKHKGLLVMLEKHPFMNMFEKGVQKIGLLRAYDDVKPRAQDKKRFWRISDISTWLLTSGLKLYAIVELQANYDLYTSAWYSSMKERIDDNDRLSELANNPISAIPEWLVVLAYN